MKKIYIILLVCVATASTKAVLVDDFGDGDMSEYVQTVVLDLGSNPDTSQIVWSVINGTVWATIETYDGIEQSLCLRDDYSLGVGDMLYIDTSGHVDGSQDIGLVVAATKNQTPGLRQDYVNIYMRDDTTVYSRGFDGTSEFGLLGGSTSGKTDALFIERTAANTFVTGYYIGSTRYDVATRTVSNTAIGTAIGFYTDMRSANTHGGLDNLQIITPLLPPTIVTHPNGINISEHADALFETVFTSQSTPSASWYKVALPVDIVVDSNDVQTLYDSNTQQYTSTLMMSNLTTSDSGQYYCRVNNDSNLPQNSNTANLVVYGLVAHWTLDQNRYADSNYLEDIGGYHAAVNGTPTFVTGADGKPNSAVQITSADGWALCPVFDPVKQSGQFTVSFWVNWGEAPGTQQDIQVESTLQGAIVDVNSLKADEQWQHICTVFDGSTGKLYVDGILAEEGAWLLPVKTEAVINIGTSSGQQDFFNGAMDDVRLFNYALTDANVAEIRYNLSGERSCILAYDSLYDLTGPHGQADCIVDIYDLAAFVDGWLTLYDFTEFADFSSSWQSSGLYPTGN